MESFDNSILLFDKPKDWTSFDLVKKFRNVTKVKKVGHAGTLDPLATGLLILCTGKRTKEVESIQEMEKEYKTEIIFGATTPSYDAEFPPENLKDTFDLTKEAVEAGLKKFIGEILQVPPIYSAIKIKGQRAYQKARQGTDLVLTPRPVSIHSITLNEFSPADPGNSIQASCAITMRCSKGTYVRSLVHDLGQALETGAYIRELRRTAIGEYLVENAWGITEFSHLIKQSKAENE